MNYYECNNNKFKNDARWIEFKEDLLSIFDDVKSDGYNNLDDYLLSRGYDSFICWYGDQWSFEIEDFLRDECDFSCVWDIEIMVNLLYDKYLKNNAIE